MPVQYDCFGVDFELANKGLQRVMCMMKMPVGMVAAGDVGDFSRSN